MNFADGDLHSSLNNSSGHAANMHSHNQHKSQYTAQQIYLDNVCTKHRCNPADTNPHQPESQLSRQMQRTEMLRIKNNCRSAHF